MQITLKKADELQRVAMEAANRLDPQVEVSVSAFTKAEPSVFVADAARAGYVKFVKQHKDIQALLNAAYDIRQWRDEQNSKKINALLNRRALLEALEKRLSHLIDRVESSILHEDAVDETVGRIERVRAAAPTGSYSGYDNGRLTLSVVSNTDLEALRAELAMLRAKKSDLTDQIAGLNLNTKITLSETVVNTLRAHNLIA